jgi:uncharacterized membrane protein YhaH (DUF805 family)/DnaJ-domain-containing protein 1
MTFTQIAFSFKGRIGRKEYWIGYVLLIIGFVISGAMMDSYDTEGLGIILTFALIWPGLAISVKRWHDRDKSGWWVLINIIPWIGPIWSFIEQGFLPGTNGPNRFGGTIQPDQNESYSGATEQNAGEQFEYLYGDLVAMLAKMAKSDGVVSQEEISTVNQLFDQLFSTSSDKNRAIAIFRKSKDSFSTFEEHARAFSSIHSGNFHILKATIESLFFLSISDGGMSAEEELLLNAAESILGVQSESYAEYKRRSESSWRNEETKDSAYYAKVLGLSGRVTKEEIRKRYKELVMQYHPDKVAHLGERLKEVAHEEIKKINEAYEYLKKTHDA